MDPDILETLYIKYYKTAYIYTFSLSKNKEVTEDIVSEAFVKAFITLDDDKKYFKYWLLVVCKNLWIDFIRKNKKIMDTNLDESFIKDNENVIEKVIDQEKNLIVYKAIMTLQKNYQEILILFYYGNIPLIDIAEIMNLSRGNAKTMISRARGKLKMVLEESGYEF
ncbi:RNA polymerase sigma-70 factor (ECF subfamily) [Natranaerovirga pectinivora]|uniref:RNA polymerase sigma-70 factor (ECF subfamily) n=1 Tax=Natranaerovirga pectinivora TaxID=682400 RepID=A0A4R3MP31_9FIRM|nr:sigma-70 family RNA polymerase sigma factor [Natranaerovirga pectinivora]TCT17047.1 RNA polymerase sigma-70 factor (ECF subfamily) [Natranaerovirga pectinivora]